MSKKESLTLWQNVQRTLPAEQETTPHLVITDQTEEIIRDAFNSKISEDLVKAYKTPLDNNSLAKVIC